MHQRYRLIGRDPHNQANYHRQLHFPSSSDNLPRGVSIHSRQLKHRKLLWSVSRCNLLLAEYSNQQKDRSLHETHLVSKIIIPLTVVHMIQMLTSLPIKWHFKIPLKERQFRIIHSERKFSIRTGIGLINALTLIIWIVLGARLLTVFSSRQRKKKW